MVRIVDIFSYLSSADHSSVWKTIAATSGVFPMIVKLWMLQPDRNADDLTLPTECSGITGALATFLQLETTKVRSDSAIVRELTMLLGADKQRIAKVILAHIRLTTGRAAAWELSFPLLMDVATTISSNVPGVSNALLSQNAMVDICHAMTTFTSRTPTSSTALYSQMMCTSKAIHYFLTASLATDGFTWITQAVRSGILYAILRSALWSKNMASISAVVLYDIEPYTVYRSILRVVGKVMLDPVFRQLESQLEVGSDFQTKWVAFKSTVQANLAMKATFDEGGKYFQPCSAFEVSALPALLV
jgi:hypothetical protein